MSAKSYKDQIIWIVGASSGIGASLADKLVKEGARVAISARREEALKEVAAKTGAEWVLPLDVTEPESIQNAKEKLVSAAERIDRIVFLSGSYNPMNLDELDMQEVRSIVDINLIGTFNFIHEIYPQLLSQGGGQLALCASISGYGGLPHSQPYAATKAAMINLTESLQVEAAPKGVDIKLINPGFVRTPLTDKNDFDMPFIIEPEVAAERIAKGLQKKGFEIVFPRRFAYILKTINYLPYGLRLKILGKSLRKT